MFKIAASQTGLWRIKMYRLLNKPMLILAALLVATWHGYQAWHVGPGGHLGGSVAKIQELVGLAGYLGSSCVVI